MLTFAFDRAASLAAAVLLFVASASAQAAQPPSDAANGLIASGFWTGFVDYWSGLFHRQDNIVMMVLGLGALGIFIITRGKWRK